MVTGFLYDSRYLEHDTGLGHPECPERIVVVKKYLEKLSWFKELKQLKPTSPELDRILEVHSSAYVKRVKESCVKKLNILDTPDVVICEKSYDIALLAAGGVIRLADELVHGSIKNGFALIRPPGHHAEYDKAMGFCLFNNIAILARYLQKQHGVEKILILDWDVHHGNGTQSAFYTDPSVLYISLHQYPFYPGTGSESEAGEGKGLGYNLNCPMKTGSTDKDYKEAFVKKILPKIKEFKPEVILISAGFDAHKDDPLASILLTTNCFKWMSERVLEMALEYSGGRVISILEGGYNLKVLPECVAIHLETLCTP